MAQTYNGWIPLFGMLIYVVTEFPKVSFIWKIRSRGNSFEIVNLMWRGSHTVLPGIIELYDGSTITIINYWFILSHFNVECSNISNGKYQSRHNADLLCLSNQGLGIIWRVCMSVALLANIYWLQLNTVKGTVSWFVYIFKTM